MLILASFNNYLLIYHAHCLAVRGKYRNAFQNFFTTGFDIVFQKEFLDKISDEEDNSVEIINDLNLSVTDEDLQKLDDANSRNAFYRKVYPGK